MIRFAVLSFLTIRYGPEMVHMFSDEARRHLAVLLVALGVAIVVLVVVGARKLRKKPVVEA